MLWEQTVGFVGAVVVALVALGSVVTYAVQNTGSEFLVAIGATTALTAIVVLVLIAAGSSAPDRLSNPYWMRK